MQFLKNTSLMFSSATYQLLISIITFPFFVRIFGVKGYAIFGLGFSLVSIFHALDFPCLFVMIKSSRQHIGMKKSDIIFWSVYNGIFYSNIILVPFMLFISYILVKFMYHDVNLFIYYFLAALVFATSRLNSCIINYLRANKDEKDVFKARVITVTISSIITVYLAILGIGPIALFYGPFIGVLINFTMLIKKTPYFHKNNFSYFLKLWNVYIMKDYFAKILVTSFIPLSFFIATLYLSITEIGILSILLAIINKLSRYSQILWSHFTPILSIRKNTESLVKKMSYIIQLGYVIILISMATIGWYVFELVFSLPFRAYTIIAVALVGFFLTFVLLPFQLDVYINNIKKHNMIFFVATFFALPALFIGLFSFGIWGYVFVMFFYWVIVQSFFATPKSMILLYLFMLLAFFGIFYNLNFETAFLVFIILTMLALILYRKTMRVFKYICAL